jgi:hypothetical protein
MNCAWCNPSNNGTDGVCDACMLLYFNVDPVEIHQSEFDAVPSYVETNAAVFAEECRLILEQVEVVA